MASPWLFLCVLSALARTGYLLQCSQCLGLGLSTCTEGITVTCPPGQVCTNLYQETTENGKISEFVYTACGPSSQCNKAGTFTVLGRSVRMSMTCCSTDNCTAPVPVLPSVSNKKNGKVCPMCADSNEACTPDATMDCVGSENKCILHVGKITGLSNEIGSFRGCTTKSICDIGIQNLSMGLLNIESTFFCNSGAVTAYRWLDITLSTIAALVLLKLLI